MPVSGFGGTCYDGAYEKTPNFEEFSLDLQTEKVYNNRAFKRFYKRWVCKMMKGWRLSVLLVMAFLLGFPDYALSAGATTTQVVTIRVEPFAVISLGDTRGQNWTWLVVDRTGITTGSQELKWSTNLEGIRVTVQSNLPTDQQDYILRVRAVSSNSKGTSKGWVNIDKEPSDIITDIVREIGSCSLEYEASPKISGKAGCDEHILTYTITE
jgi:hypothetical protein